MNTDVVLFTEKHGELRMVIGGEVILSFWLENGHLRIITDNYGLRLITDDYGCLRMITDEYLVYI
jgi:hypothetical protein